MATPNETRSTLSDDLGPPGEGGELIVVGQVAMATDHGGRRTMGTGGTGSPIGERQSETREEVEMETWTVRLLYGAPPGVAKASEGGETGALLSSLWLKVLPKVLRAGSIAQRWAGRGEPGSFAGSFLTPRTKASCERAWGTVFEGRELWRLAVLASGVQVAYFSVLNSTLYSSSYTYTLYSLARYCRGQWTSIYVLWNTLKVVSCCASMQQNKRRVLIGSVNTGKWKHSCILAVVWYWNPMGFIPKLWLLNMNYSLELKIRDDVETDDNRGMTAIWRKQWI